MSLEINENTPEQKHVRRYLSPKEYAIIISMVIASVYLMLISFFPLIYNFTSSFSPVDFSKNLFIMLLAIGTINGVFSILQKETHLSHIADQTFSNIIYQRLEPVLRDVAEVQVGLNNVNDRLEMMNLNIDTLAKKRMHINAGLPEQSNSYIKYIILINITLGVFLFMVQFPLGYIPYATTVLFIIWWAVISLEFGLWKFEIAWAWVFFPIIVLPIYTIIMNAYLSDYQLFGTLSIGLCIYTLVYYSWCSYTVKGILPFDLHNVLHKNDIKTDSIQQRKFNFPKIDIQSLVPTTHQIAISMILLSIALFAISWFSYAIEHDLIPDVNWGTIGLQGFEWYSSYTYSSILFGIFLILMGFRTYRALEK